MFKILLFCFIILGSTDAGYVPLNVPSIEENASAIGLLKADMAKLWKELQQTNGELQKTNKQLLNTNKQLETTNEELRKTQEELQRQKEGCGLTRNRQDKAKQKRLLDYPNVIHQIQVDVQNLKSDVVSLQSLKTNVSNLQNQVLSTNHFRIGFTAVLSKDVSNLGDNQPIVFDSVITNLGNNYNPRIGVFTCEVPGLYVFYVNTLAEPGKHLETIITKNLSIVAQTYAFDKEYYSSGSNMAVVELVKGDNVMVKSRGGAHDHDGAIIDYLYTSFSGFLINQS